MQSCEKYQENNCLNNQIPNLKLQNVVKKTDYVKSISEGNSNSFFVNSLNISYLMKQNIQLTNNCILVHISNKDDMKKEILNQIKEEIIQETYRVAVISMRYNFDYMGGLFNTIVQNQNIIKLELEFTTSSNTSESFDQLQNIALLSQLIKYYISSPSLKYLKCSIKQNQICINDGQATYYLEIPQKIESQSILDELFLISEKLKVKVLGICIKSIFCDLAVYRIIQFIKNSACILEKINLNFSQIEEQNLIQILDVLSQIKEENKLLKQIDIVQKDMDYFYKQDQFIQFFIDNNKNIQYNFGTFNLSNDTIKIIAKDQEIIGTQNKIVSQLIKNISFLKTIKITGNFENIYPYLIYLQQENFKKRLLIQFIFLNAPNNIEQFFKLMIQSEMLEFSFTFNIFQDMQEVVRNKFLNQTKYSNEILIKIMTFQILEQQQHYLYQKYNYLQYDLYFD